MRGYFDALLRATGVDAGGQVRSVTPAAPGVVELDQESQAETTARPAAPPADRLETRTTQQRAQEFESPVALVAPAAPITSVAPVPQIAPVARLAPQPPVQPVTAPASIATAGEAPADLGQTMVRAAMRWVAADAVAQQVGAPVAQAQTQSREVITPREVDAAPRRQKFDDDLPSLRIGQTEAVAVPPDAAARPATTTPAMIPPAPLSAAPVIRDEVFEVSIGTIHVRVDAPAVQTVRGPQAPAPTPPRATAARPQRSALSRRALRRI